MRLPLFKHHKLGSVVFGIIWILFSSIFVIIGLWMSYGSLKESMWKEVPCVVTSLKVKASLQDNPPFTPIANYKYKFDNASYTGTQVTGKSDGTDDYEELGGLLYQHQKKQIQHCYVNPDDPQEAVLFKPSSWGVIFGIIFASVGALFVFIGIAIMRQSSKNKGAITQKSRSDSKGGRATGIFFFGIFATVGFIALFFMAKKSMTAMSSQDWVATPAKVIWSRIISRRHDGSTTYRPEVFFSYQYQGIKHRSNTYKIDKSSSSGLASKQKVVARYARGKRVTCYVNPEKPYQAVIEQKIGLSWLMLLFPLPFIAIGVGGLIAVLRGKIDGKVSITGNRASLIRKKNNKVTKSTLTGTSINSTPTAISQEEVVLSPGKKRFYWFLGAIAIALFWNGIVSIFLKEVIGDWQSGSPNWLLTIFLTPFLLVGLGFIIHIPYRFLAMFNPAPRVTLPNGAIIIGEDSEINWETPSGAHKIKQFKILLVGTEEAQYRRGTNTKTDRSIFYELDIFSTTSTREITKGSTQLRLPIEATNIMPSWEGEHNSIIWTLEVVGEIPLWPDAFESYPLTVLPAHMATPNQAPESV